MPELTFCVTLKDKSGIDHLNVREKQPAIKTIAVVAFFRHCTFLFIVTCPLPYGGIWLYASLNAYKLKALQYIHYQDVFGTLDIDKWSY